VTVAGRIARSIAKSVAKSVVKGRNVLQTILPDADIVRAPIARIAKTSGIDP
jgi:hypothetical protein